MKLLRVVFVLLSLTFTLNAVDNYAVVSSQEVIMASKAYASFSSQMERFQKEIRDKFAKEEEDLKKIEQDLVNKRADFAPKEFEKRKTDFENRVAKFRKDLQNAQQKFEQTSQEVSKSITDSARQIIMNVVKEKKYEVVYEAGGLLYYPKEKDITKEILAKLDAKLPKVTVKKPY